MIVVGLTGSFGTGKTFVASILKSFGAKVIDADKIAHSLYKKGSQAYIGLIEAFGEEILDKTRNVDRRKLARIVFGSKKELNKLNRIMHPLVIEAIKKEVEQVATEGERMAVIDAPLLLEVNLDREVDKLIVVKCSRPEQIRRMAKKFGMSFKDVVERIKSQIGAEEKIRLADFVIDNDGTRENTKKQVRKIWRMLWR